MPTETEATSPSAQTPTAGRIVHFNFRKGQIRPAIVIETEGEVVSLRFFSLPKDNPARDGNFSEVVTKCKRSEDGKAGTWNWPVK